MGLRLLLWWYALLLGLPILWGMVLVSVYGCDRIHSLIRRTAAKNGDAAGSSDQFAGQFPVQAHYVAGQRGIDAPQSEHRSTAERVEKCDAPPSMEPSERRRVEHIQRRQRTRRRQRKSNRPPQDRLAQTSAEGGALRVALVNDEVLASLREEADHSMEHQLGRVGAQEQNDVAWVQICGNRLNRHPGPNFDRGSHAPADDVARDLVPLIEEQSDSLWMQVHECVV